MRYSCDFVQAPPTGDPNSGSCLSSTEGHRSIKAAVKKAATRALQYAKPGRIHGMVYVSGSGQFVKNHTAETVEQVRDALTAD